MIRPAFQGASANNGAPALPQGGQMFFLVLVHLGQRVVPIAYATCCFSHIRAGAGLEQRGGKRAAYRLTSSARFTASGSPAIALR
jgi:hypothetical protein